ncbi:DUF1214 domain-containing protein [Flavobacterium humidisoli]|uniref:DUF1214 domain-containing protein n=1 Tax=Flavobacterium humidisoli TaxID=2937442 RepID=A0ABY4LXN9_9FLAO|nr:DUF1214 domain-containing protein [Flavobacterium humidisoli]UPZ17841.1 DUF1214 domain-containing protein [Flavobacterium humidisoli]
MKAIKSTFLVLCSILSANIYSQHTKKSKDIEKLNTTINTFCKPPKKNTEKLFDPITLPNGKQKVTIDNFVRAETDNYFKIKTNDGCFGKLCHNSGPADVNHQSIIRTNRDTRYSYGIFDLSSPLNITIPDTKGRFVSMMVINEDSYIRVFYEPGNYTLTRENVGTRFIHITVRTLADPNSPEDNKIVTAIQESIVVKQASTGKLEIPDWDEESLTKTRNLLLALAKDLPNSKAAFGTEWEVTQVRQLLGTAGGYGGNPEKDAIYLNLNPPKDDGATAYTLTLKDVPVDAFWSVSLYNEKGYYEVNKYNSYNFNSITSKKNPDGSVTIHFGGDPNQPNFLYIMKGWNYMIRLYRPHKEILNGTWKCPELVEVKP